MTAVCPHCLTTQPVVQRLHHINTPPAWFFSDHAAGGVRCAGSGKRLRDPFEKQHVDEWHAGPVVLSAGLAGVAAAFGGLLLTVPFLPVLRALVFCGGVGLVVALAVFLIARVLDTALPPCEGRR